jgi:predicted MFS family arabinose efflux permease
VTADQDSSQGNRGGAATRTQNAPARARWRSGPLGVRSFRLLAAGQFTSTVGDCAYAVALPWLVLSSHGGPVLLGVILTCYGVPRTVLIPVGGILADKIGGRTLMLATDVTRCAVVAVLTVLAARHLVSLAWLGPVAVLVGAGEGLFMPASFTIMPSLLDTDQLGTGNSLYWAIAQAGTLLGPALGGSLVATAGPAPAFALDAGTFAVSAITLALIPRRPADRSVAAAGQEEREPARGVLALLRSSRVLQLIVIAAFTANLAIGGMSGVALPTLAHEHFGADGYGALLACFAGGSIAGTLAGIRGGSLRRPAIFASVTYLLMAAALAVLPFAGGLPGAAIALLAFGAFNGLGNVIVVTRLQMWVPPALLGRVTSVLMTCMVGAFPLSVAVTGVLVRHVGPAPVFPIAAIPVVGAVLWGLTQREWRAFGASDPPAGDH